MMIPSKDPRKALTRLQLGGEVWEDLPSPPPHKRKKLTPINVKPQGGGGGAIPEKATKSTVASKDFDFPPCPSYLPAKERVTLGARI